MTYDEAKKALAAPSELQLRDVLLATVKEVEYLRGFTDALKERLEKLEKGERR